MALVLKTVPAGAGTRWIGDAFRLFAKRPMGFLLMSVVVSLAATLVQWLPLLGALVPLMAMPILTLGFMVAGQSALLDGPVHPRQFLDALGTDATRRRALLKLCLGYGVAIVTVLLLAHFASDRAWERMEALGPKPENAQLEELMPSLVRATLMMCLGGLLVSVPFWHAPALVHWGGQGVRQALFSSTLAVWRNRGAFALYGLAWFGVLLLFGLVSSVVLQALGLQAYARTLITPGVMVLSAVFYISVLFTFNDCFGGAAPAPSATPTTLAE